MPDLNVEQLRAALEACRESRAINHRATVELTEQNKRLRMALAEISELKIDASVDDAITIANDALDALSG